MPRFFMMGTNLSGGTAYVRGRDAEHIRVLRIRPGDDVVICDGRGSDYKCRLIKSDREEAQLEVLEVTPCVTEPNVNASVLCGLPKGSDRTEYIIQKSVETGADSIVFFSSARCVARPDEPEKKLERWQRIAEEAAKQTGRGVIPQVSWAGDFIGALDVAVKSQLGLFMYETGERERLDSVLSGMGSISSAAIITGPEGGFEQYEADAARAVGMHICSMGQRILRCESAPVAALTALMFATGNLS